MIRVFAVSDCQYTLPGDSREAKDIENAVKRQTWDLNDLDRAVSISQIKKVDNPNLEREYHEKKAELRHHGRSLKELSEQLAFCVETEESRVKEICRSGLECSGVDHTLGDGDMGVTVWKCPDLCLKAVQWPSSRSACLIVFKVSNVCCIVTLLLYNNIRITVASWEISNMENMVIGSCKGSLGAFYSDQNSKKFRFEVQQNGTFLFGSTGILRWSTLTGSLVSFECTKMALFI